jgi:hypothetical protein
MTRPKVAYQTLEANPELEFEHFLAEKLSRTVTELRDSLSNEEFIRWSVYYARQAQRDELEAKRGKGVAG